MFICTHVLGVVMVQINTQSSEEEAGWIDSQMHLAHGSSWRKGGAEPLSQTTPQTKTTKESNEIKSDTQSVSQATKANIVIT